MLGVATIQVFVFVVTTGFWMALAFGAGGKCGTSCDWAGGQRASLLYFGIAALSFVITIVAASVSYRTGRDLAWVPLAASLLIIGGYFPAANLFAQAMG